MGKYRQKPFKSFLELTVQSFSVIVTVLGPKWTKGNFHNSFVFLKYLIKPSLQGTSTTCSPLSRHHRLVEDTIYESLEEAQIPTQNPTDLTPKSLNPNLESFA